MQKIYFCKAITYSALVCILYTTPCAAQMDLSQREKPSWNVQGKISKDKNISGIACIELKKELRRCLIAVDEGYSGILATLDGTTIRQDDKIRLAPEKNEEEFDAEGVAYDHATNSFYVIGSHGRSRRKCKPNPSSYRLVRLPINPRSGQLDFDHKSNLADPMWVAKEIEVAKSIEPAMRNSPLHCHVDQCLGTKPSPDKKEDFERKQGANIEGLAILDNSLYVGFRGPVHTDTAYLLKFPRDAVFNEEQKNSTTIPIRLGKGIGIRDLASTAKGLLILAGPEDDDPGNAAIHYFVPEENTVIRLETSPDLPTGGKPEGLLLLEESATTYKVLVFSDDAENGNPTEVKVAKKN